MGEHFVVHGSYALAAAIDRGSTVQASLSDSSVIVSRDLGLTAELPMNVPRRLTPLAETLKATLNYLDEKKGVKLEMKSNIPVSAGLGSSAAGSVALVTAASSVLGHTLKDEEIVQLAMVSERIIHGNPSGIDPAVSTYGGVMLFKKGLQPSPIKLQSPAEFIVAFSGAGHSTSKMIKRFSKAQHSLPSTFSSLVQSSSTLAENAASAIASGDLTTLAAILNFNQCVLSSLGVSSVVLDSLVEAALDAGCIAAKLTGGGGGGCVIALPVSGESDVALERMRRSTADAWVVKVPRSGVRVWRDER